MVLLVALKNGDNLPSGLSCANCAINIRIYFTTEIKPTRPRKITDIEAVPDDQAYQLQRLAGKVLLDARQARLFALALLEPSEVRQRVVEQYIKSYRTLEQEVAIGRRQVPNSIRSLKPDRTSQKEALGSAAPVLLPVIVLPKGAFSDNFQVFGADGEHVSTLAYREYLQLVAGILRLFFLAYGLTGPRGSQDFPAGKSASADSDVRHLEHKALCEIVRRADANVQVKALLGVSPVSKDAEDIAKLLEKLDVPPGRKVFLNLAAELVRRLSLHYAMVASVQLPQSGRICIRYRRALIPELELAPDAEGQKIALVVRAVERGKGWLRVLFSTRPVSVTVSLYNSVDLPELSRVGQRSGRTLLSGEAETGGDRRIYE